MRGKGSVTRSGRPRTRPRVLTPLVLVLLAAIFWLAWDRFSGGSSDLVSEPSVIGDGRPRQVYYGPPNSVAVLPFRSSAPNRETEAQAEGFAVEIQRALIGMPALQVTARSSSFFFRQPEQ